MFKRWMVMVLLSTLTHSPAFAIDAKYAKKLDRSGCTQVSELQGCDINKTRKENAIAGFVTEKTLENEKRSSQTPFDCRKANGSIEKMICVDAELATFDRALGVTYSAALRKADNERPPRLKAEQRGWIKGRNDCWKSAIPRQCVVEAYRLRIAELQARYRLLPISASATFGCDGDPRNELVINFFQTDPPSLMAEHGDRVSLMYQQPTASGVFYQGRNESFREHQGKITVTWGFEAPEMHCTKHPDQPTISLTDTVWELVAIQSIDDTQGTLQLATPESYTVRFAADGRASFRIDCNRGSATWKTEASSSASNGGLEFGPLATTRAMCPPGSLAHRVSRDLEHVRSFMLKDGRLYLSLIADGGILEWRPTN